MVAGDDNVQFIPTGPLTITSAVIIFTLSTVFLLFGSDAQKKIAIALIFSWVGARSATVTGSPIPAVVSLTVAAFISFLGFTRISRLISYLYGLRLAFLSLTFVGLEMFWFWEVNRVLLYFQIILATGTMFGNGQVAGDSGSDRRGDYPLDLPTVWNNVSRSLRGSGSGGQQDR